MEKQDKKLDHYHEIQQLFRYHYRNDWVSQSFINLTEIFAKNLVKSMGFATALLKPI